MGIELETLYILFRFYNAHIFFFFFCRIANNNTLQRSKGKLQSVTSTISFLPLEIPLMEEDP